MPFRPILAGLAAATALGAARFAAAEVAPHELQAPKASAPAPATMQTAVFSGGCFWGVQGVFSHVRGVTRTVAGYAGGARATANYPLVSTGMTGHAESVEVTYDPRQVSYADLLRVFFSVALDPTEVNRQGPDDGSQYRSVVWTADPAQQHAAQAYIRQLDGAHAFPTRIATKVEPLHGFYRAESYHQDFLARHPDHPYIQAWDVEKVAALKAIYPSLFTRKAQGV